MAISWVITDVLLAAGVVGLFLWRERIRQNNRKKIADGEGSPLRRDQIVRRRVIGSVGLVVALGLVGINIALTYAH